MELVRSYRKGGCIEINLFDINGINIGFLDLIKTVSNGFCLYYPVAGEDNLYRDYHRDYYYDQ